MSCDAYFVDLMQEIERRLGAAEAVDQPQIVLVCGPAGSGKTTRRRQRYSSGFVHLDAAELFRDLCNGEPRTFGEALEQTLEAIGQGLATRALLTRRSLTCELVGLEPQRQAALIHDLWHTGYHVVVERVECDPALCFRRAWQRPAGPPSAIDTEPYHLRWLWQAAREARRT